MGIHYSTSRHAATPVVTGFPYAAFVKILPVIRPLREPCLRRKEDSATHLWLAPQQSYLPLKIEQEEDGRTTTVSIKSWEVEEAPDDLQASAMQFGADSDQDDF